MEEKFLPIGTVVILKGATKKIMITGFMPLNNEDKKAYDYLGCPFPEGYVTSNEYLLFNHEQIETIFHKGFVNEESNKFNELIHQYVDGQNKDVQSNETKEEKKENDLEVVEIDN